MPLITKEQLKISLQSLGKIISFKADKSEVELKADKSEVELKMNAENPVGSGSFSMGRKFDTIIGNRSHAEGFDTTASGFYSHAEGNTTTASGESSHAEGSYTKAFGRCSHTEGLDTEAPGDYSHAEGSATKAFNTSSHAEGSHTEASGVISHAEGFYTKALGNYSHAEGSHTEASNDWAHAEGYYTKALGADSHAEGYYTTASEHSSHAEGYYTTASEHSSHAEGYFTTASGQYSHAEGKETTASGESSHAEGSNTTASSIYSHAEGNNTTASGVNSHAEGNKAKASGETSHAEGYFTTASGKYSHAEGYATTASKYYSHAEGYETTASGETQHVQGKYNIEDTNSTYAHIVGNGYSDYRGKTFSNAHTLDWKGNAWYSGDVYVSSTSGTNKDEGSKKLATEEYVNNAMAELEAKADKTELEAKMNKTNPTGTGYFSLNRKAGSIIGDRAFAEGDNNVASGHASHAEGKDTTASGYISHAEGHVTTASGWYSHAEGYVTEVSGRYSHVEGNNTVAFGEVQHVQGKFNLGDSQSIYAHIVGNGTHVHDRSNAHTLDWEGNAWYSGDVYVGSTSGSNKDEGSKKLATEEFVNNKVAKISNTDWNDLKNNLSQSIDNPWYYPIDAAKIEIYYQDSLFCTFVRTNLMSERGTSYWKYSGSCNNITIRNILYGESFDFNDEENQAKVFFSTNFDRRYYDASGNGMMNIENNLIAKKNQSVTWLFGHLADMDENHVWNVINYFPITCNDCGKDNVALAMDMAHKYIAGLSNEPTSQNLKLTDTVTGIEYMITIVNGKVTLTEVSE